MLLDTSALQSNYIKTKFAGWLERNNVEKVDSQTKVCSAFNECKLTKSSFKTKISFLYVNKKLRVDSNTISSKLSLPFMEGENKNENTDARKRKIENESQVDSTTYEFELKQIDIPFDVIIGRKSIVDYHLLRYDRDFSTLFGGKEWQDGVLATCPGSARRPGYPE